MSLPREILDQLLSGYVDGTLSEAERTRMESLLATDPEVAAELEAWLDNGQRLRDVFEEDRANYAPQLSAANIAAAAFAAGEAAGVDHAASRVTTTNSNPASSVTVPWRSAAALVALAASIVIAVFVFRPDEPVVPQGGEVAVNGSGGTLQPGVGTVPTDAPEPAGDRIIAPEELQLDNVDRSSTDEMIAQDQSDDSTPSVETIASDRTTDSDVGDGSLRPIANLDERVAAVGPIMLVDVSLTEAGREQGALDTALKVAGIPLASQREVSEAMVSSISANVEGNRDQAMIMYLQASATRLDKLFSLLLADVDGFGSVRLGIVDDVPMKQIVVQLNEIDPTKVRQDASWQLGGDAKTMQTLTNHLESGGLAPMPRGGEAGISLGNLPNVPSQMILLVR